MPASDSHRAVLTETGVNRMPISASSAHETSCWSFGGARSSLANQSYSGSFRATSSISSSWNFTVSHPASFASRIILCAVSMSPLKHSPTSAIISVFIFLPSDKTVLKSAPAARSRIRHLSRRFQSGSSGSVPSSFHTGHPQGCSLPV